MKDTGIPEKTLINSIIGEGTKFKGEFDLEGLLRIDGDFSGIIRTKGKVLIGSNGRVECTMYAGTVVIGGIVRGDIYSNEKVTILSTGMVIGNIQTPRLVVEDGVIFNGKCNISKNVRQQVTTDNELTNDSDSILKESNKSEYMNNEEYIKPHHDETVVSR